MLAARDYHLGGFESWAARRMPLVEDADDRRAVLAYLRWHQRPRLATFAEAGKLDAVRVAHARQQINAAAVFLEQLRANGQGLETLAQGDVDALFADMPARAVSVRDFLLWAVRLGRCPRLRIPCYRSKSLDQMPEEHRLEVVQRLLHDTSLDLGDRVAGLLVLMLAQRVARIARLRIDDVGRDGDEVTLRLARTPAPLPGPLGALVGVLVEQRRSQHQAGSNRWLFPGRPFGQPAGAKTLATRLRKVGVTRRGRRAALAVLAGERPAPMLVDVLGYSRNFAAQCITELRVDWRAYAALKARDRYAG